MSKDEAAIRQFVADWLAASRARETEKVLSMMADDVIFLQPGQAPMKGKVAFAAAQAQQKDFRIEAQADVQEVQVVGDWAWLWTNLQVSVTPPGGETMRRAGNALTILHRNPAGQWLLYRDANLLAPA